MTKRKVQETLAKKKNPLPEQTEDNLQIQIEALEQTPQKVVAEVEEQNTLTEALRDRVKEKLKTVKAAQEKDFYYKQNSSAKGFQNKQEVNAENEVPLDEGFEFFTSTFEDHFKMKELDKNVGQKSTIGCLQNICDLNEQTPLLIHEKEMLTELLEVKSPTCNFNNVDKEKGWNHLFFPSTSPVIHSCKLPINMLPRLLEEEGFYIPRKPYIPRKMYHKMENRLQQEGAKGWFEESGEIISLPSPIKQSSHPIVPFPVKTITQLKTTYRKAMRPELENCAITKSDGYYKMYQLDLYISSIVFSHHFLFNCEQVLAVRLLDIYECFQKRQQQNVTNLLSEKLKALISATKLAERNLKTSQLSTNTLKDYRSQIRNTKILYDKEQQRDNYLIQSMLKVWKQMKSLRKQQGFISTTIKLQFQRQTCNSELDEYEVKIAEDDEEEDSSDSTCASQPLTDLGEGKKTFFIPHLTFIPEITAAKLCPLEERKRREKV
ncbi:protein CC2D2B-like, partial [Python bivittatus]|uniref:Protein CC2D2B-like n=1 Tax=Python bivittatus TaxID=176946 RepID=A0A9F5MXP4_PYTBI